MKPIFFILAAVLVFTFALMQLDYRHGVRAPEAPLDEAKTLAPAMDFAPLDAAQSVPLVQFRGRYVLLNIWASWCTPCVKEFPDLLALADAYPRQLQLVTLSVDRTPAAAQTFLNRFDTPPNNVLHAYDAKQKLSRDLLQIYRYPESVLIGPKGKMLRKFAGALTPDEITEIKQRLSEAE